MGVEDLTFLVTVIPYELRPLKTVMRKLFIFENAFGKNLFIKLERINNR